MQIEELDLALTVLSVAIDQEPDNAKAYYTRGLINFLTSRFYPATVDADAAIRLNPDYFEAYGLRGTIFLNLSRWEEAVVDFQTAYNLNPDYIDALYGMAQGQSASGDFEGAKKSLELYFAKAEATERNYSRATVLLEWVEGQLSGE